MSRPRAATQPSCPHAPPRFINPTAGIANRSSSRARRLRQAADRRAVHAEQARDVCLRVAGGEPAPGLGLLMWCELRGPAELHAAVLGPLAPLAGALPDQLPLELGKPT